MMTQIKPVLGFFFFILLIIGCSSSSFKSGGGFSSGDFKEVRLSNGMTVLLLRDDSLPYISLNMMVDMGTANDPADRAGLANFVSGLLDKGTQKKTATELADEFGQIGSQFSASVDHDYTMLTANTLSRYQNTLLDLFAEVVTLQSFQESEINRQRTRILSIIKKSSDDPSSFISLVHAKHLYGKHAYGQDPIGNNRSVRAIQRRDIIRHYKKHFRPNNVALAVVGNYSKDILKELEVRFKDWVPMKVDADEYGEFPSIKGKLVRLVDNPSLTQAQIRIGHMGIKRSDPDFLKLRVANTILGSGFVSRLMDKIRDDLGLTYTISSSFDARVETGPFGISTFTKIDTIGKLITETLKVYREFQEKGINQEELDSTKSYLLGIFPQAIDTKEKLAYNLLVLRRHGISYDYLAKYQSEISKIGLEEVNAAIKKHFDPQNLKITVYAPAAKAKPQLDKIGKVQVENYRIYQ